MSDEIDIIEGSKAGFCLPNECTAIREQLRNLGLEPEFFPPDPDGSMLWVARPDSKVKAKLAAAATRALA